ncbi:MAG: EF-hand domain-containing protein [Alphaproteobacteria bacterium]|nr:EF-hand domain-containing protein [Alphaproteobacteria bacterium]
MKTRQKIALFFGVVTVTAGAGLAWAQMEGAPPPDGPMQGMMRDHERFADRLLREFDLNHDGKVSHDEMNRTIGARFAAATHHAPTMTLEQFMALHQAEFRQHTAEMFRRLDWKGDGKLTLEEYAAPQRVRFMTMDKDGAGFVSCAPAGQADYRHVGKPWQDEGNVRRPRSEFASRGNFGLAGFCFDNDLDKDGKVTRAEFNTAVGKRFALAANGAATMNAEQFAADLARHFRESNARTFKRLDKDGDGTLTLAEFAANELKMFARLDRNKDGVIAADEMRPKFRSKGDRGSRFATKGENY